MRKRRLKVTKTGTHVYVRPCSSFFFTTHCLPGYEVRFAPLSQASMTTTKVIIYNPNCPLTSNQFIVPQTNLLFKGYLLNLVLIFTHFTSLL